MNEGSLNSWGETGGALKMKDDKCLFVGLNVGALQRQSLQRSDLSREFELTLHSLETSYTYHRLPNLSRSSVPDRKLVTHSLYLA